MDCDKSHFVTFKSYFVKELRCTNYIVKIRSLWEIRISILKAFLCYLALWTLICSWKCLLLFSLCYTLDYGFIVLCIHLQIFGKTMYSQICLNFVSLLLSICWKWDVASPSMVYLLIWQGNIYLIMIVCFTKYCTNIYICIQIYKLISTGIQSDSYI